MKEIVKTKKSQGQRPESWQGLMVRRCSGRWVDRWAWAIPSGPPWPGRTRNPASPRCSDETWSWEHRDTAEGCSQNKEPAEWELWEGQKHKCHRQTVRHLKKPHQKNYTSESAEGTQNPATALSTNEDPDNTASAAMGHYCSNRPQDTQLLP